MSNRALTRSGESSIMEDFFRPWNDLLEYGNFTGRTLTIPSVNIAESKDDFTLSLAVPGMKKDDFNIDVNGNMLTISCEKEERREDKDTRYSRKEYNYSSFSRSFTLHEDVNKDKIDARYEDGILRVVLPKREEVKKLSINKHISVK